MVGSGAGLGEKKVVKKFDQQSARWWAAGPGGPTQGKDVAQPFCVPILQTQCTVF